MNININILIFESWFGFYLLVKTQALLCITAIQGCNECVTTSRRMRFSVRGFGSRTFLFFMKGIIKMADYKRMYLNLLNEVEETIQKLKAAEQACEDIYVDTAE